MPRRPGLDTVETDADFDLEELLIDAQAQSNGDPLATASKLFQEISARPTLTMSECGRVSLEAYKHIREAQSRLRKE